jgi:hypothetical protein
LSFSSNSGQVDRRVQLLAHGAGYAVGLTRHGVLLALDSRPASVRSVGAPGGAGDQSAPRSSVRTLSVGFIGASRDVRLIGTDRLAARANYLIGNDRRRWQTNVPTFSGASYRGIWRGIDASFTGSQHQLEYMFTVAPGADPRRIQLDYKGQSDLRLDRSGDLVVSAGRTPTVRQLAPNAYQWQGGERVSVASRYELTGDRLTIKLGVYDHRLPLVIDPTVTLDYSTYLGGNGLDFGAAIAVDLAGNVYVTGTTNSTNFPTASPYQGASLGSDDAFVTKLNATGTAVVYSTYLGGSGIDFGNGIAVDPAGDAYVTGMTQSANFPLSSALQTTYGAGGGDAFVTKLNPSGNALVYSTYLGGNGGDEGYGIAVDPAGNAYVTGFTRSTDFPTANAEQGSLAGTVTNAFVTKLNPAGSALVYSTYLGGAGGSGINAGYAIAVDSAGSAYITGKTGAPDFPTMNPEQGTLSGSTNAFVTKFSAAGSTLVYSTYLGGTGADSGLGIAVDSAGSAYVTGQTTSTNFPTMNPEQPANAGGYDAFVTKLDPAGSALAYSTYLGGSGTDGATAIAVDADGSAYVTGGTFSADFPIVNPEQATYGGGGYEDAFVTQLSADGTTLGYSTYLGGSNDDYGAGIAVDPADDVYITGDTQSSDFPTKNAEQPAYGGGVAANAGDAFVATFAAFGKYTLTISRTGPGSGSVTSSPARINCGTGCSALFASGTAVMLGATPAAGSRFAGFTGAGCSGTATCTVTMSADQSVTATFDASSGANPSTPVNVRGPAISGRPLPGDRLKCSTGLWTNDPTSYRYLWKRAGSAIPGATTSTYTVQIADEAQNPKDVLTCVVTASNAAGAGAPAGSAGVLAAVTGTLSCPRASGAVNGSAIGVLKLGLTKSQAHRRLRRFQVTHNEFDNFCLYAGWGIRVAYPSPELLRSLPRSDRHRLSGTIVIALTANPYYSLDGARPGMKLTAVARRLHVGKAFHIGSNYWYIAPGGSSNGVVKVQHAIIQEVGIVNKPLTRNRTAQKRLLTSFKNG